MGQRAVVQDIERLDQPHAGVVDVEGALARRKTQAIRPHKVVNEKRDGLQILRDSVHASEAELQIRIRPGKDR